MPNTFEKDELLEFLITKFEGTNFVNSNTVKHNELRFFNEAIIKQYVTNVSRKLGVDIGEDVKVYEDYTLTPTGINAIKAYQLSKVKQ